METKRNTAESDKLTLSSNDEMNIKPTIPMEAPSLSNEQTAPSCRLYLISPERIEHPAIFAAELRAALDGGDVAAFQLRLKGGDERHRPRRRYLAADLPAARRRLHHERPARPRGEARLRRRACRPGRHALRRGAAHRRARPPGRRHLQGLAPSRHGGRRSRRRLRGVRRLLPVRHQGRHHAGRTRHPRVVERADGSPVRGDRRHHGRQLQAGGRGRRRLPGGLRRRVEPQGRPEAAVRAFNEIFCEGMGAQPSCSGRSAHR